MSPFFCIFASLFQQSSHDYECKRQYCNHSHIQREGKHREDYPCGVCAAEVLPYPRHRRRLARRNCTVFIVERSGKLGLGTAYIAGFKWALERDYGYIFEMDADFSHDPNDLPRLYSACADEGYDLAIGSRYVSGVNVVNWPIGRVLMSYFASKYVRLVTGFKVHDTTAGFKCYKRRVLKTIELDKIRFKGYGFQIEMKFTAYKIGFKIKEVPVIFINRREGVSKMSGGIFGEAFFGVMRLRWDGWTRKYPKIVDE